MGVNTLWLTGVESSARADRQILTDLYTEGVKNVQGNHFKVVQRAGGANMTVTVRRGDDGNAVAYVTGDDFTGQGLYRSEMDADWPDLAIAAAPSSGSRTDLVVWETVDKQAIGTGTVNESRPRVLTGVSALTTAHKTMIPLASITVAAGQSSIQTERITDLRTQAGAATLRIGTAALAVASTSLPAGGVPGALYYASDANSFLLDNGGTLTPVMTGFGNGSDGDVVVTGTSTLTRHMQYRTLTVATGGTLVTNGWTIRASRSVTVAAGGVVHDDGGNGYPGSGNQVGAGGSSGGGGVGENGRAGYQQNSWPNGGGGGGGGGVVAIVTPTLVNNGTIRANGGAAAGYTDSTTTGSLTVNGPIPVGRFGLIRVADGADYFGGLGGVAYNDSPNQAYGYISNSTGIVQALGALIPASLRLVGGGGGTGSGGSNYRAGTGGGGGLILIATARRSGSGAYAVNPGGNSYGQTPASANPTAGNIVHLNIS